jgi:hypothetical protein
MRRLGDPVDANRLLGVARTEAGHPGVEGAIDAALLVAEQVEAAAGKRHVHVPRAARPRAQVHQVRFLLRAMAHRRSHHRDDRPRRAAARPACSGPERRPMARRVNGWTGLAASSGYAFTVPGGHARARGT